MTGVVILHLWLSNAFAEPPCMTMSRWSHWQSRSLREAPTVRSPFEHVDAFETPLGQVAFSEHFALHWGVEFESVDRVDEILTLLEDTWTLQVEEWGMLPPTTDRYFNVYLGSTGDNMPSDLGVAGYYDVDDLGSPMVVLGNYVTDSWSIAKTTIPHEFFHAVQHRTGSYTQFADRWYWEASATWVEQEVLPSHPSHADFLFGYALRPYLPLAHFELYSSGNIEEYHPYGAFIVLQFLTEHGQQNTDVVASWMTPTDTEKPIGWWHDHLDGQDLSLGSMLSDFSAHNVFWDYEDSVIYETQVASYVTSDPMLDERVVGTLSIEDTAPQTPAGLRPGAFGYNCWTLDTPVSSMTEATDTIELWFDGTTVGDHFNAVDWRLQVVYKNRDGIQYRNLPTVAGEGVWSMERVLNEATGDITLVVLSDSLDAHIDERFTYSLQLRRIEEPKTMGCLVVPLEQVLLIWWVPVLGLLRQRRSGWHPIQ